MGRKESNQTKQVSEVVFELYTFFMGGFRGGGRGHRGSGSRPPVVINFLINTGTDSPPEAEAIGPLKKSWVSRSLNPHNNGGQILTFTKTWSKLALWVRGGGEGGGVCSSIIIKKVAHY